MPLTVLAAPKYLTRADLLVAARAMLSRYERIDLSRLIEWHSERELDNVTVRMVLDGRRTAPADVDVSQEVLMAFLPDREPRAVVESLYRMGLMGRELVNTAPASPDEALHAGLLLLDHPDWFPLMARVRVRVSPQRVVPLMGVLDEAAIGLALDLGMDDDWFTTAASDPSMVSVPALRTMAALRPSDHRGSPFDRTVIRL